MNRTHNKREEKDGSDIKDNNIINEGTGTTGGTTLKLIIK